jgi:hypothetical protein
MCSVNTPSPEPGQPTAVPPVAPDPVVGSDISPARQQAALALDVLRRTVRYGLRASTPAAGPRYLAATCGPIIARVPDDALEPQERHAVEQLRQLLAAAPVEPAPLETLQALDGGLGDLASLLSLAAGPELEPRALLLPEGEGHRAKQARERQAELEAKRKAREELPPVKLPESDDPAELVKTTEPKVAAEPEEASQADPDEPTAEGREERGSEQRGSKGGRRSQGRRRGRSRGSNDQPDPQPAVEQEPPRAPEPPPPPRRALRDPEGAGQDIEAFFPELTPPTLQALAAHGVSSVADLLLLCPVELRTLPRAMEPSEALAPGQRQVLRGTVERRLTRLSPLGRRHEVVIADEQARVVCRWVTKRDQRFWDEVAPGARVALHGLVELDGETTLLHEGELVEVDSRGQGREACYGLEGLADVELHGLLRRALDAFADHLLDPLPGDTRKRLRLLGLGDALRRLHFPVQGAHRGRERMAFDELLLYQLGRGIGRKQRRPERGTARSVQHRLVAQIMASRSHSLTDGQEIAFSDIRRDLARPKPMNRLLQGDVGVGKGFVALLSAVIVAEGREQVVFIAPDALAAEHRFLFAEPLLRSVGLMPALILGKPDNAQADALRRVRRHGPLPGPWPELERSAGQLPPLVGAHGGLRSRPIGARGRAPGLRGPADDLGSGAAQPAGVGSFRGRLAWGRLPRRPHRRILWRDEP